MDISAIRMMKAQPLRLSLTIGSVALCVVLMIFLLSIYGGVADGAVQYIRQNEVDLWVLKGNSTNILRGSSILSTGHGVLLREISDVALVSPILMLLPAVKMEQQVATVFLTGYDASSGVGGPPEISEGRSVLADREIVLDKAFAAKYQIKIGENVQIQDDTMHVVGLSSGTNAFVIQYAFVTLQKAQSLLDIPGLVTCYLVRLKKGTDVEKAILTIREELPGLEVYDHKTFLQNNVREMESGFLSLLYSIAFIGTVVLTAILSLLLSINILERKKDFAIMKALGSPKRFLPWLVIQQALLISCVGSLVAILLYFVMVAFIDRIAPEVATKTSVVQIVTVIAAAAVISVLSSFIALQRLRRIYPLEVYHE